MRPQEICIIIPVYNAEKYIEQAIASIVTQPCGCLQIVCVNDGAKDSSPEILDRLAQRYQQLHVIHQPNQGVSVARNTGIEYALKNTAASYFCFLDADDFYFPGFFGEGLQDIMATGKDLYAFSLVRCNELGTKFHAPELLESKTATGGGKAVWSATHFTANLYSRRLFEKCGIRFPYGVRYCEDQILLKQCLALSESIEYSSRLMYVYRSNAASAMARRKMTSAIDYYTPIVAAWRNSDAWLNDKTDGSFAYGSTLASLYMLDMAREHFQQFGSAKRLSNAMQANPQFLAFCSIAAEDFAPEQYAQYLEYRNHPLRFQIKNVFLGMKNRVLYALAKIPWCARYYESKKFPLTFADLEQRSKHA